MVTAMRHEGSSVSDDVRSCNILDSGRGSVRVQGCQASAKCQEPGCQVVVVRARGTCTCRCVLRYLELRVHCTYSRMMLREVSAVSCNKLVGG